MRRPQNGFTLLELLIGMTLMTLLMITLVIGIHIGIRAWERGQSHLRETRQQAVRTQFLARQISSLIPYRVALAEADMNLEWTVLEATPERFRFLSTYDSRSQDRAGLELVEYAIVRTSPREVGVFLRETPVQNDQDVVSEVIQGVTDDPDTGKKVITLRPFLRRESDLELMKNLSTARFEYLAPPAQGGRPSWVTDYAGTKTWPYPQAVRLSWQQGKATAEETIPIRARTFLESQ